MASVLGQLLIELGINTAAFKSGLDKSTYQAKQFASELKENFADLGEGIKGLGESFGLLTPAMSQAVSGIVSALGPLSNSFHSAAGAAGGIALAALGVGASVLTMAAHSVEAANRMDELSQSTGVAVSTLSGLSKVAAIDGVGVESLAKGLEKMGKSAFAAASAAPTASNAYKTLGIAVTDANGGLKDQSQLFTEVADKFAVMKDGGAKTALAIQIFGRAGAELIPVLNRGGDNVNELVGHFQKLGAVLTDDTAAAASKLEENFALLQGAFSGVQNEILTGLAPAITELTNGLVAGLEDKQSQLQAFVSGLVSLGKGVILTFQFAGLAVSELGIAIKGLFAELLLADDGLAAVGDRIQHLDFAGAKAAAIDAGRAIAEQAKATASEASKAYDDYAKHVVGVLVATNPASKPHGGGGQDIQAKQANIDFIAKTVNALTQQAAKEELLANSVGKVSTATIAATAAADANTAVQKIWDEAVAKGIQNTAAFRNAFAQAIPKIQEAATWLATFKAAVDTQNEFDSFDKKIREQIASLKDSADAGSVVERQWAKNNATLVPLKDAVAQLTAQYNLLAASPGTDPAKLADLQKDLDRINSELVQETANVTALNLAFQQSKGNEKFAELIKQTAELRAESDGLIAGNPYAKMDAQLAQFIKDYDLSGVAATKLTVALHEQEAEMTKIAALGVAKSAGGFDPTQVAQLNAEIKSLQDNWQAAGLSEEQYNLTLAAIEAQQADLAAKSGGYISGITAGFKDFSASITSNGEVMRTVVGDGLKGISQNLTDVVTKGKADWQGLVNSMEQSLLKSELNQILNGLLKSIGGFLSNSDNGFLNSIGSAFGGGKAVGGDVTPGKTYLVGEKGPELFQPGSAGTIVPNGASGNGGGATVVQNWNITTPDADSFNRSRSQVQSAMYRAAAQAHGANNS